MGEFVAYQEIIPVAEDKFEAVDPLARVSREQGYVLFEDAIELIPPEVEGLSLDALTLDAPLVVEERSEEKTDDRRFEEADDFIEIESLDKTHDPVRLYLREMVPCRCSTGTAKSASHAELNAARRKPGGFCRDAR